MIALLVDRASNLVGAHRRRNRSLACLPHSGRDRPAARLEGCLTGAEKPKRVGGLADGPVADGPQNVQRMGSIPENAASGRGSDAASVGGVPRPLRGLAPSDQARIIFASFDAKDVATLASVVSDDVRMRLGNAPEAQGKTAFVDGVRTFVGSVAAFHHHVENVWHDGDALIAQLEVGYTRHDGKEVTLPCCNVFRIRDGLLVDYRVYMDISPVYA
jgi:ketosteroid isomerase-like protein